MGASPRLSVGAPGSTLDYARGALRVLSVPKVSAVGNRWLTCLSIEGADVAGIALAVSAAVLARYSFGSQYEPSFYLRLAPGLVFFILAFALAGLYPGIVLNPVGEIRRIFRAVTFTYLGLGAATFLLRGAEAYSRSVFLTAWTLSIIFVVLARTLVRICFRNRPWWGASAIVMGSGPAASMLIRTLEKHPSLGLKVVAQLGENIELAPLLAAEHNIAYGILAMPEVSGAQLSKLIERYAQRFQHLLVIPDLFGMSSLWVDAKDLGGVLGLEVSQVLLLRTPQLVKRVFDVVFTSLGLIALLPLFALIALAIKLNSRGPVFYGHTRYGRDGALFKTWKFRSMFVDGDRILREHLERRPEIAREWSLNQKIERDPRVTVIGRMLRRTSLDELPQIWNVLRGEMSLVGPRPIAPYELARYGDKFEFCSQVRPGITGLWQVSGRNSVTYQERIHYNEYYVRNWSMWLDLYILGRTVDVVLSGKGAY